MNIRRLLPALCIAPLMMISGCGGTESPAGGGRPDRGSSVSVVTEPVTYRRDTRNIEVVGTARARASAVIYPETGGEVMRVNFEPGQKVTRGTVLLEMESREERLAVRNAEVAVKSAEQLLARYNRIDVPGAISKSQIEEAETSLEAAKIALEVAENRLRERSIRAPFTGNIGLTNIDPGARITPTTAIATLDDRETLFVDFEIAEEAFGDVAVGDVFSIMPFSDVEASYQAKVITLGSAVDRASRGVTVRTEVENPEDKLRPGMSFRISLETPGVSYAAVPEAAIVWGGDGAYLGAQQGAPRPAFP